MELCQSEINLIQKCHENKYNECNSGKNVLNSFKKNIFIINQHQHQFRLLEYLQFYIKPTDQNIAITRIKLEFQ